MFEKEKKLPVDDHRIDIKKTLDLRYWSTVLKTTPDNLKKAVEKAGNSIADVKKILNPFAQHDNNRTTHIR